MSTLIPSPSVSGSREGGRATPATPMIPYPLSGPAQILMCFLNPLSSIHRPFPPNGVFLRLCDKKEWELIFPHILFQYIRKGSGGKLYKGFMMKCTNVKSCVRKRLLRYYFTPNLSFASSNSLFFVTVLPLNGWTCNGCNTKQCFQMVVHYYT